MIGLIHRLVRWYQDIRDVGRIPTEGTWKQTARIAAEAEKENIKRLIARKAMVKGTKEKQEWNRAMYKDGKCQTSTK